MTHAYDNPDLDSVGLLLAVMRDTSLPLAVRVDAADKLLPIYRKTEFLHITITGGLSPDQVAARLTTSGDDFAWDMKPRVH